MIIRDIMTIGVQTVGSDETITDAAQKMRNLDVGLLPVVDDRHLVGAISDRDIVVRAVARGVQPPDCRVRDIMTSELVVCFEHQQIGEAANLMRKQKVRRLFVLDKSQNLIGMLSLGDLANRVPDTHVADKVLHGVSESPLHYGYSV